MMADIKTLDTLQAESLSLSEGEKQTIRDKHYAASNTLSHWAQFYSNPQDSEAPWHPAIPNVRPALIALTNGSLVDQPWVAHTFSDGREVLGGAINQILGVEELTSSDGSSEEAPRLNKLAMVLATPSGDAFDLDTYQWVRETFLPPVIQRLVNISIGTPNDSLGNASVEHAESSLRSFSRIFPEQGSYSPLQSVYSLIVEAVNAANLEYVNATLENNPGCLNRLMPILARWNNRVNLWADAFWRSGIGERILDKINPPIRLQPSSQPEPEPQPEPTLFRHITISRWNSSWNTNLICYPSG